MVRGPVAIVIEDDADISELTEMVLSRAGFTVVRAADGPTGLRAVREHEPILTTLDVQMPGMDGFEVARTLRLFSRTYLIMITARAEEADVIEGFEAGADDYLTKPFRPRELRMRADAVLRRSQDSDADSTADSTAVQGAPAPEGAVGRRAPVSWVAAAARELRRSGAGAPSLVDRSAGVPPGPYAREVVRYADLELDPASGRVALGGHGVDLEPAETDLLAALMATGRRVRSKADLALALDRRPLATSYFVKESDKRIVDAHIDGLRRKLGDDAARPRFIETVGGVGYRMAS